MSQIFRIVFYTLILSVYCVQKHWNNCSNTLSVQWEVPPDYINVILGIKDNLTKDLVYILMAKGLHCIAIKV